MDMNEPRKPVITPDQVGVLTQVMRTLRLVWRLLNDSRVPTLPKLIIPAALIYLLSPIDLVPDMILGLGQLDDVGILMIAVRMFIEFCPPAIVDEHRQAIARETTRGDTHDEEIIDGTYREVHDDEPR